MTALKVAIIGDRFMRPTFFEQALVANNGPALDVRSWELDWPDSPMLFGEQSGPMAAVKEYLGEPNEVVAFINDATVLVTHLAPVTAHMLDKLPALKLVAVSRGGPVNIDARAAAERGVSVVNAPGRNATAVAEFTVGAILAQTRLITAGDRSLASGQWRGDLYRADVTGKELSEMTVGLIGFGAVGSLMPDLLLPFGCRILVNDPYVQVDHRDAVEQTDLDTLLAHSDVVSLHARVTSETRGFLAAAQFARMRPGAYFINTARGPMVDYGDLYQALASGHMRGAMLDTFDREPPPADAPILRLDNVTVTPHIAGASVRTVRHAAAMMAAEVARYCRGERFNNAVV